MKNYKVCVESWSNTAKIGENRDGTTALHFLDYQEEILPVVGYKAAREAARSKRKAINAAGRGGWVIVRRVEELGDFAILRVDHDGEVFRRIGG